MIAAVRSFWRARFRPWWRAYESIFVAAVALATLVLAFIGTAPVEGSASFPDRILRLLSAIGVGYPLLGTYEHPAAKAARWLAAGVTIVTIAKVWSTLFRDRVGMLSSRWKSGHAVICGLGEVGSSIGLALRSAGIPVVGIDRIAGPGANRLRSRGIASILGDARDEMTLRLAGVERARFLIAICGDDEINAEVLASTRRLVDRRPNAPLTCVLIVSDLALRRLMRGAEFAAGPDEPTRLQCVNLEDRAARALVAEHPPPLSGVGAGPPHVLLIGLGRFGESLLLRLARWWMLQERAGNLVVSVVDGRASERTAELLARQRALGARCTVHPFDVSTRAADFENGRIWKRIGTDARVDAIYVCLSDAETAIAAALALHSHSVDSKTPIVVRTWRELGLASLLAAGSMGLESAIRVFPMLPRTCTADLVLHGANEQLAEALHEVYLARVVSHPELRDRKALLPWVELPEEIREENRIRADQLAGLLRAAGFRILPLMDWDEKPATLEATQVEQLSKLEHERWLARLKRAGWSVGPERDDARKVTPLLVEWEELPEDERQRNRAEILALPSILARADLSIVPLREWGRIESPTAA